MARLQGLLDGCLRALNSGDIHSALAKCSLLSTHAIALAALIPDTPEANQAGDADEVGERVVVGLHGARSAVRAANQMVERLKLKLTAMLQDALKRIEWPTPLAKVPTRP